MNKVAFGQLGAIQRTMILPLFARARESRHRRPIVRDERAEAILAELDVDISALEKEPKLLQVVACVAATIYDRWITQFLDEHPEGVIVEIGPGLDTRYERIDNGRAMWFDIDLPDAIAVRRRFFEETARRRMIAASILTDDWIDEVRALPGPFFFVAEGVLFYFAEADVKGLYDRIATHFPGSLLAHDSCVRGVAENSEKVRICQIGGARFQWGIDDIHEVEDWDKRYRVVEVDSVLNHFRHRYPLVVRLATWLIAGLRKAFTTNLVRLG